MHQIDGATAQNNRFKDFDGVSGTVVSSSWLNAVQDELCNAITGSGLSLQDAQKDSSQGGVNANQLMQAIFLIAGKVAEEIAAKKVEEYKNQLDEKVRNLDFNPPREDLKQYKFKSFDDMLEKIRDNYIYNECPHPNVPK